MKVFYSLAVLLIVASFAFGQTTVPRQSQRQEIRQVVGDTTISINYGQPNMRGRKIWGGLVPFNEVWRAGADENTTFEFSRAVTINGKELPAGKYGFHVLPAERDATVIFSKDNDKWGSFTYNAENDALRVPVKVETGAPTETLSFSFSDVTVSSAKVTLAWGEVAIPLTIDIGDVHGRSVASLREAISKRDSADVRPLTQAATYVLNFQVKASYGEALGWVDQALAVRETFQLLSTKSRLLAADGKVEEAISVGERAVSVGKSATPPANTADFERFLSGLKSR